MGNFFDKLKKGMGDEINNEVSIEENEILKNDNVPEEKNEEEISVKKTRSKKPKKIMKKEKEENFPEEKLEIETKEENNLIVEAPKVEKKELREDVFESKGELAVDVYQTDKDFVIQSAIAGVGPEDIDISIEDDVITIKGIREKPVKEKADYFCQECFWGPFSKEIILPVEVDSGRAESSMKDGILTIRMPKISRERKRKITIIKEGK